MKKWAGVLSIFTVFSMAMHAKAENVGAKAITLEKFSNIHLKPELFTPGNCDKTVIGTAQNVKSLQNDLLANSKPGKIPPPEDIRRLSVLQYVLLAEVIFCKSQDTENHTDQEKANNADLIIFCHNNQALTKQLSDIGDFLESRLPSLNGTLEHLSESLASYSEYACKPAI